MGIACVKDFFGRLGLCTRDQKEVETQELGLAVKKERKTFDALETGGACNYNRRQSRSGMVLGTSI